MLIDALYDISVQLELGNEGGGERDPGGMQFGERDRLVAGLAQLLEQPLLLRSVGVIDRCRPSGRAPGRAGVTRPP